MHSIMACQVVWTKCATVSLAGLQVQSGINIQADCPKGDLLPVRAITFEAPRVGASSMPVGWHMIVHVVPVVACGRSVHTRYYIYTYICQPRRRSSIR